MTYSIEFGSGADRVRIEGPEPAAVIQILRAFNETHNVTVKPSGHFYAHPQGVIAWKSYNPDKPADKKPTPDPAPLKWGCEVESSGAGCFVKHTSSKGLVYLAVINDAWTWSNETATYFADVETATYRLDRCTTPPPGWEE